MTELGCQSSQTADNQAQRNRSAAVSFGRFTRPLQNAELMTKGKNFKLKRRAIAIGSQESRRQRNQERRTSESKEGRQPPSYQQLRGLREPQSMPKVKTHHWAGVTLSMKNMFGIVPGAVYGWPKNVLHWQGIEKSILDICSTLRPSVVIADGIVAMEGNGPLHGSGRSLNRIVLSDDPVAADFICARLMGLLPEKIYHLEQAARFLGNGAVEAMQVLGESMPERIAPFDVLPQFRHLQCRVT